MKQFAEKFYASQAWKDCRKAYKKSVGGLCERCLERGLYKPAEIIHHKIFLNQFNVDNPEITLNWNNLVALCRDCHADVHSNKSNRYMIDETGNVEILKS